MPGLMTWRPAAGLVLLSLLLLTGCNAKDQADGGPPSPVSKNAQTGDAAAGAERAEPAPNLATARPLDLSKAKVMDLSVGPRFDQAGLTTERVGGISDGGPTALAATADGRFYVFDAARSRLIEYRYGRAVRFLPVPYDLDLGAERRTQWLPRPGVAPDGRGVGAQRPAS